MVNGKLRVRCPCGAYLSMGREIRIPFVRHELLCLQCGSSITITHPDYVGKNLSRLPTCLDCGNPIPKIVDPHLTGPFRRLSRTCPMCWVRHRNDEPGDDLGVFVRVWYRHGGSCQVTWRL